MKRRIHLPFSSLRLAKRSFATPATHVSTPTIFQNIQVPVSFLVTEEQLTIPDRYRQYPIRKFSLKDLGVPQEQLVNLIKPYYRSMSWDYYDVRRNQIELLQAYYEKTGILTPEVKTILFGYYRGNRSFAEMVSLFVDLPDHLLQQMKRCVPFRKKAASMFRCYFETGNVPRIEALVPEPIAQYVAPDDIRSIPRIYPEIHRNVTTHPLFVDFIQKMSQLVSLTDPSVQQMDIVLWQTSLTPSIDRISSNSPEGIHQDGADYIISAIVMERENVIGAESVIYQEDKQTVLYESALQPGEGIFQADTGSPIWHTVTPVKVQDPTLIQGLRNTVGFDFFNLIRKT